MANRNVLVTGGAGFIGGHVAEAYLERGDRVWVVDDLSTGRESNIPDRAEFVHASLNDDAIADLFEKVGGFDVVSHHAAQADVRKSVADPRHDARVNLDGLLNLLEACRSTRVGRFIFVSSGGVIYGEPEVRPTVETSAKQPLSPYGVSKLASELYLNYYRVAHGLDYAALRYGNVYGPRQDPHGEAGVVAIFCMRLLAGEPLMVYGDGQQTRDYVFILDVVAANMLVTDADMPAAGDLDQRAYNVGTGVETSVRQLAESLKDASGRRADIVHAEERSGELRNSCLDASRLRALGWRPQHAISAGLSITYRYIENGERGW